MRRFIVLFCVFSIQFIYAQLNANFNFSTAVIHETCPANGGFVFTTSNATVGSSIVYEIYLLPNTTTPIITTSSNSVNGLIAGSYSIKAIETLGANSQTKTNSAVVLNQVLPFDFTRITFTILQLPKCNNEGIIRVNLLSGTATAVSYEITAGPVVRAAQASNTFENLPSGLYTFRLVDACGRVAVKQYSIPNFNPSLTIQSISYELNNNRLPACDAVNIKVNYTGNIAFPLVREITVKNPSGVTVFTQNTTMNSGLDNSPFTIPFYNAQNYIVHVKFTDACGLVYERDFTLNNRMNESKGIKDGKCGGKYLVLKPIVLFGSYTVQFISAPSAFVPATYNSMHPGPFFTDETQYGSETQALPQGFYVVRVTDQCGSFYNYSFTVPAVESQTVLEYNLGKILCTETSRVGIYAGNNMKLVSLSITNAPSNFGFPLPHNVSSEIDANGQWLGTLPFGTYTFIGVDECGNTRQVTLQVISDNGPDLTTKTLAGCGASGGSVHISGANQSIHIVSAPAGQFTSLPVDVTYNVHSEYGFLMNGLRAGDYTFQIKDSCGGTQTKNVHIDGETSLNNAFQYQQLCGTFNLFFNHETNTQTLFITPNQTQNSYFGIQKYNSTTGNWEHPETGLVNGEYSIQPNVWYNNLNFVGKLRIIKRYHIYENGSQQTTFYTSCYTVLQEFEINDVPKIISIYKCESGTNNDVIVNAVGNNPLTYKIIKKNGLPFVVNNGTNNLFTNIENATYTFEVTDVCGNKVNRDFDISLLSLPNITQSTVCENETVTLHVYQANYFTYKWYKTSNPSVVLSTSNTLSIPNFTAANSGEYKVEISSTLSANCNAKVISTQVILNDVNPTFTIPNAVCYGGSVPTLPTTSNNGVVGTWFPSVVSSFVSQNYTFTPNQNFCNTTYNHTITISEVQVNLPEQITGCKNQTTELDAGDNFATYLWNTGETTQKITVTENGTYTVTVGNSYGCTATDSTVVVFEEPIENVYLTFENGNLIIINPNLGSFEYSIDAINWQTSNVFVNPNIDPLIAYVRRTNGSCFYLVKFHDFEIPNIITPNSDGINDVWNIAGIERYLGSEISIFDRYGKLLYQNTIKGNPVWESTYLNSNVPSTSYWFTLKLTNGEFYSGYLVVKNRYKK